MRSAIPAGHGASVVFRQHKGRGRQLGLSPADIEQVERERDVWGLDWSRLELGGDLAAVVRSNIRADGETREI